MNWQRRKLMELSGVKPTEDDVCECLLVGCRDQPNILVLNDDGMFTSYWRFGFESIGIGHLHAWIAYKALTRLGVKPLFNNEDYHGSSSHKCPQLQSTRLHLENNTKWYY